MWGAGAGSWIGRWLTAANTSWKGMSWGTPCIISWFGKLKNSSNLFGESPFMFPLWFGAVSKTLCFKKPNNKPHPNTEPSWGPLSLGMCPARSAGGKVPFYPGPASALRALGGDERTTKWCHWAVPLQSGLCYLLFWYIWSLQFSNPARVYLVNLVTELLSGKQNTPKCQCCTDFPSV